MSLSHVPTVRRIDDKLWRSAKALNAMTSNAKPGDLMKGVVADVLDAAREFHAERKDMDAKLAKVRGFRPDTTLPCATVSDSTTLLGPSEGA